MTDSQLKKVLAVSGAQEILEAVPLDSFKTILDVGLGAGTASEYFANNNKQVTAIGLNIQNYNLPADLKSKIKLMECDIFAKDLDGLSFDAVWFSHCLEHIPDTGRALQRVNQLLKENGWLFIMVPPYSSFVSGGHLITGWSIGQLMYLLILYGFDVKNGHFIEHGYNICGFVQKKTRVLPELNFDRGDIELLAEFWPKEIKPAIRFEGNIKKINWPFFDISAGEKKQGFLIKFFSGLLWYFGYCFEPIAKKLKKYKKI